MNSMIKTKSYLLKVNYLILLSILSFSNCKNDESNNTVLAKNSPIAKTANTYFTKLTELNQFNGVVLIRKNNTLLLHKAYNTKAWENKSLNVSTTSQFDIRSVSKLFAKASINKLVKAKKLDLNENIHKYVPEFPEKHQITLKHLINHTSGLPRELSTQKPSIHLSQEDIIKIASKEKLEFKPGTKEQYSNVGFQLIYYIIGQTQKSTFINYLENNYFNPLHMNQSGSNFLESKNEKHNYAYGHYIKNDSLICDCKFPDDEIIVGNIFSTSSDLDAFLNILDDSTYSSLKHNKTISHAGGTRGKRAYIERNFEKDYQFVFLTNIDMIPFDKIVKNLRNILINKDIKMPEKVNRNSISVNKDILKKYEGTYDLKDAGHILLNIKLVGHQLHLFQKGVDKGILFPETETIFFADSKSEESIEFKKDETGKYYILIDFQGVQWKGTLIPTKE